MVTSNQNKGSLRRADFIALVYNTGGSRATISGKSDTSGRGQMYYSD